MKIKPGERQVRILVDGLVVPEPFKDLFKLRNGPEHRAPVEAVKVTAQPVLPGRADAVVDHDEFFCDPAYLLQSGQQFLVGEMVSGVSDEHGFETIGLEGKFDGIGLDEMTIFILFLREQDAGKTVVEPEVHPFADVRIFSQPAAHVENALEMERF